MKIKIICPGHLKEKYLKEAQGEYLKRLSAFCKFEIIEVDDEKTPDNPTDRERELILQKEGERILSKIKDGDYCFSLEIKGKERTSEEFAEKLNSLMVHGKSSLVFIIGGSLGLGENVLKIKNESFSFSKMTLPHQLIRINLLEQIYRAFKIINNEPYHK